MSKNTVSTLKPSAKNPRKITDKKLEILKRALHEFGDLSGIVFNRASGAIVSGHQRIKTLDPETPITVERQFKKPTRTGTVAEGFILLHGERYNYREVEWDDTKEKAAALAANNHAGTWDTGMLAEHFNAIGADYDFELTGFSETEIDKILSKVSDDVETEDKTSTRTSSSDVKSIPLKYTSKHFDEFNKHVAFFKSVLNIESTADVVLEVLRSCHESYETDDAQDDASVAH